jgi:hypothetical protein
MADLVRVPSVQDMDDETLMLHFEHRHSDQLKLQFKPEPDSGKRRLHGSKEWRTFHETIHRLEMSDAGFDHEHKEQQ